MKHFDRPNQVRPSGDKRGLLFQFMTEIFVDVTRMNHGRDKTPDVHDPLLPRSAFDHPAWLPGEEETWLTSVIYFVLLCEIVHYLH